MDGNGRFWMHHLQQNRRAGDAGFRWTGVGGESHPRQSDGHMDGIDGYDHPWLLIGIRLGAAIEAGVDGYHGDGVMDWSTIGDGSGNLLRKV